MLRKLCFQMIDDNGTSTDQISMGDAATMDARLIGAGMAVAELAVHESESHSGDTKIHICAFRLLM